MASLEGTIFVIIFIGSFAILCGFAALTMQGTDGMLHELEEDDKK